ncbi:MAG: hypothetical protein WBA12_12605, partial [Catalinimonas sp.]
PVRRDSPSYERKQSLFAINSLKSMANGSNISIAKAKKEIANYIQETGFDPQDPNAVLGYVFDLSLIKTLIQQIDAHNKGGGTQITGVRIYQSMTDDNNSFVRNVVVTPVDANLQDVPEPLYDPNPTSVGISANRTAPSSSIILGQAMPCPNQCGSN